MASLMNRGVVGVSVDGGGVSGKGSEVGGR